MGTNNTATNDGKRILTEAQYIGFVLRLYYRWERENGCPRDKARRNTATMKLSIENALRPYQGGWGGLRWGTFPSLFNDYLDTKTKEQHIINY